MSAAVILPSYNEVQTAPVLISQLLEYDIVSDIVLVDDDSPDGTAAVCRD
ncbi:MAG: glycosyltransferase, partial [Persicimonas sp.]